MINDNNDYGWFSMTEDKIIFYIGTTSGDPDEVVEAIFAVVNILGKTLPSIVDVKLTLNSRPESGVVKLVPSLLIEDNPVDHMSDHMGPISKRWFPLARLIIILYHNIYGDK